MTPLAPPTFTTEAEDLRTILDYLGLPQSSQEAQRISGLAKSGISEVLGGKRARDTSRRRHLGIVASVIRELAAVREASTGTPRRGASAVSWLHTATVRTSAGQRTPLEVLADTDLALEALSDLRR